MEMGILPPKDKNAPSHEEHMLHMSKGYYNDPRDENGEVPF